MLGADRINEIGSADDLTVNESSATILDPDPDPDPDSVTFPEENRSEDGKRSATLFQCDVPMHIWQGMMTHLTNETVEEQNEDTIIDIDEDDAGNNANTNANQDANQEVNQEANQDDETTAIPMMREVDQYDSMMKKIIAVLL